MEIHTADLLGGMRRRHPIAEAQDRKEFVAVPQGGIIETAEIAPRRAAGAPVAG